MSGERSANGPHGARSGCGTAAAGTPARHRAARRFQARARESQGEALLDLLRRAEMCVRKLAPRSHACGAAWAPRDASAANRAAESARDVVAARTCCGTGAEKPSEAVVSDSILRFILWVGRSECDALLAIANWLLRGAVLT